MELSDLKKWLDEYGRIWEQGDKEAVVDLYTDDVRYYETPFAEPYVGLEAVLGYARGAAAAQRDIRFTHNPYSITGDTGIASWHASFVRVPSGVEVELDGVFVLQFDKNGKCRELREWWHRRETEGAQG